MPQGLNVIWQNALLEYLLLYHSLEKSLKTFMFKTLNQALASIRIAYIYNIHYLKKYV